MYLHVSIFKFYYDRRRERGMCRICYSSALGEFDVSSDLNINVGLIGGAVSTIDSFSEPENFEVMH